MWHGSSGEVAGPGVPRGRETYAEVSYEGGRLRPADLGKLREMVRTALRSGCARLRSREGAVARWELNYAGECDRPVVEHFLGKALPLPGSSLPSGARAYRVTCLYRCRQCEWCKWMRSMHWSHRATTEFDRAARTWLGTITLAPVHHAMLDAKVALRARELGHEMREYTAQDVFRARCDVFGKLVTKWLKRSREAEYRRRLDDGKLLAIGKYCVLRPRFSYLLVAEEHKSVKTSTTMIGRPHYHILIHEKWPYELVRRDEYYVTQKGVIRVAESAMIRSHWQLGFTHFELARDSRTASYLCKYLAKDMQWRVRASLKYGEEKACSEANSERPTKGETAKAGHPDKVL